MSLSLAIKSRSALAPNRVGSYSTDLMLLKPLNTEYSCSYFEMPVAGLRVLKMTVPTYTTPPRLGASEPSRQVRGVSSAEDVNLSRYC